jgi:CheY-like chemotaxis protein
MLQGATIGGSAVKTILVVDNEPVLLEVLKAVLEHGGYTVVTSTSGKEALSLLESVRPDLILCDIVMPEMDGLKVREAVNADPLRNTIPMLMMTAAPVSTYTGRCAGTPIIAKPFGLGYLLTTVEQMIN